MRIAVLSDIHANIVALDAVLDASRPVDAIWHLGDVVGYGPDPDAVVDRLREVGAVGVRGNHDTAALGGPEIDWFNPDARAAMEWTRSRITRRTRSWLAELPVQRVEGDCTLVHGSPRDPLWEYVTSRSIASASLDILATRIGLHGHTHVPIAWSARDGRITSVIPAEARKLPVTSERALINPGSVGQPRDGLTSASWLELDTDTWTVTWRRVAYDVPEVQSRMRSAGLPRRLIDRLDHGA